MANIELAGINNSPFFTQGGGKGEITGKKALETGLLKQNLSMLPEMIHHITSDLFQVMTPHLFTRELKHL